MINYTEKGLGLHEEVARNGYRLWKLDGEHYSSNDVEVQKIIDSYDPLPKAKESKKAEILKDSNDILDAMILSKYPRFEVDTWQNQKADSEAYILDNNATTLTLDALASQRGTTKLATATKILEKAAQFAVISAKYAGERQRLEDLVDAATTVEQVELIKFQPIAA